MHKRPALYRFFKNLYKEDLGVSRLTAANYLNKLAEDNMLQKEKLGTGNYYINTELFKLLAHRL